MSLQQVPADLQAEPHWQLCPSPKVPQPSVRNYPLAPLSRPSSQNPASAQAMGVAQMHFQLQLVDDTDGLVVAAPRAQRVGAQDPFCTDVAEDVVQGPVIIPARVVPPQELLQAIDLGGAWLRVEVPGEDESVARLRRLGHRLGQLVGYGPPSADAPMVDWDRTVVIGEEDDAASGLVLQAHPLHRALPILDICGRIAAAMTEEGPPV
eukprot:CAMPEP_0180466634 /NCGR_PEP_ID=MMETSP1036_2-20121128/26575_1 /TAXON_ID=632150 /ORGANISM="Azadinium spinosum, Strain 3D9" /LENGTH=207 /DNA_ID=CAMNT_0022473551 /DNA_START=185 /DNA_END=810 /DNA_ORIENTATION=+